MKPKNLPSNLSFYDTLLVTTLKTTCHLSFKYLFFDAVFSLADIASKHGDQSRVKGTGHKI
jgi:hypothetical protein